MNGENLGGSPEKRQKSQEFLLDQLRVRRLAQVIQEITTRQASVESMQRRHFAGDSEASRQAQAKNEGRIAGENILIDSLRQEAINLGGAEELAQLDRKRATGGAKSTAGEEGMKPAGNGPESAAPASGSASSATPEAPKPAAATPEEASEAPEVPVSATPLQEPDYEALADWAQQRNENNGNTVIKDEEITEILKTTEGKQRTPEEALETLSKDMAHLIQEINALEGLKYDDAETMARHERYLAEARGDLASMQRKQRLLEGYLGKNKEELPPEAADEAAGGELDDLAPGRSAEDEATARRILDWSEAKYLYDARNGEGESGAALKAMYLKERAELIAGGMTREQADEAIMQNRGLTAEDLALLNEDVEDASDEEHYIKVGEEALAKAQKLAAEMRQNQEDGKPIVLDVEFATKLRDLQNQLEAAQAKREQVADDSEEAKALDAEIYRISMEIDGMEEGRKLEDTVAESVMLDESDPTENPEAAKRNLWELLKSRNGLKRVFRKVGTKVAAVALAVLTFAGIGMQGADASESQPTQPETGIVMKDTTRRMANGAGSVINQAVQSMAQMAEQASAEAREVNLTRAQLEAIFGEAGVREIENLNDQEYMDEQGYQRLENGVFYDDDEYQGYGDLGNKTSKYAFAMDHTETWENKDEEETANLLYRMAHENPAVLSAYLANYPDTLEYMGLPRDIKAADLFQMMTDEEGGAELQRKGLQAFEALLESDNTTIEFGTINGLVRTDYISSPSDVSPADRELKYNKTVRDNAKVFFVNYRATNADGSERVDSMVITATCMQNNVFLQSPIKSPSGTPVNVVVDQNIPTNPTDPTNPENPTDPTGPGNTDPGTTGNEDPGTPGGGKTDTGDTDPTNPGDTGEPSDPGDPKDPEGPGKTDPKDPTNPEKPPVNPGNTEEKKVKDPAGVISNANKGGTGTITQRDDYINDAGKTSESIAIPNANNQQNVESNMVADPNATDEERQENHDKQVEANKKADEIENRGPMSNQDFENLMDWLTSQNGNGNAGNQNRTDGQGNSNTAENRQTTTNGNQQTTSNNAGEFTTGAGSAEATGSQTTAGATVGEATAGGTQVVEQNGGGAATSNGEAQNTDLNANANQEVDRNDTTGNGAATTTPEGPTGTLTQSGNMDSAGVTADPTLSNAANGGTNSDFENLMDYYNQVTNENPDDQNGNANSNQ